MLPEIEVKTFKGSDGLVNLLEIAKDGRILKAQYDETNGLVLTGETSVIPDIKDVLGLYFPQFKKPILELPQPVQVVNVSGGKNLLFDDFEGLLKWNNAVIDNANAYNDSNCLKVTCLAASATKTAYRYIPITPSKRFSLSTFWMIEDWNDFDAVQFGFSTRVSNILLQFIVRYNNSTGYWQYIDQDANWQNISGSDTPNRPDDQVGVEGPWHLLKLFINVNTAKYDYLVVDNNKYDLSKFNCNQAASTTDFRSVVYAVADNDAGKDAVMWLDDVIFTDEGN